MNKLLSIMTIALLSTNAFAGKEEFSAVYGDFDNKLVSMEQTDRATREAATGMAIVLRNTSITSASVNGYIKIKGARFKDFILNSSEMAEAKARGVKLSPETLCSDEPMADEMAALGAKCSSFLISETEVMTAGHCVYDIAGATTGSNELSEKTMCERLNFVFGMNKAMGVSDGFEVLKTNQYKCQKIQKLRYEYEGVDYAIIKLDRPVKARHIFPLGNDLDMKKNDSVYMFSYPRGLSVTYTDNSNITSTYSDINLKANLDAFGGSSGAPVLDKKTNAVIGILTGGGDDFESDSEYSCKRFARYDNRFGNERVLRMSAIRNSK